MQLLIKLLSQKWNHYCTNANSVIYTAPRCAHSATAIVLHIMQNAVGWVVI